MLMPGKLKGWSQRAEQERSPFSGAGSPELSQRQGSISAPQCWLCSMTTHVCVGEWQHPSPFHCFLEYFREVTSEWAVFTKQLTPCQITSFFTPGKIISASFKAKIHLKYQVMADRNFFSYERAWSSKFPLQK